MDWLLYDNGLPHERFKNIKVKILSKYHNESTQPKGYTLNVPKGFPGIRKN